MHQPIAQCHARAQLAANGREQITPTLKRRLLLFRYSNGQRNRYEAVTLLPIRVRCETVSVGRYISVGVYSMHVCRYISVGGCNGFCNGYLMGCGIQHRSKEPHQLTFKSACGQAAFPIITIPTIASTIASPAVTVAVIITVGTDGGGIRSKENH
mmetsp:Transcript_2994/g.7895  ORF Transcript_2994/g.7895 Transcript_2994/m.7895 type:complete len:155 (-) Transcript_2994:409-873(-)